MRAIRQQFGQMLRPIRRRWRWKRSGLLLLLAGAWLVLVLNLGLRSTTAAYRFDTVASVEPHTVALIFGAGLVNGPPSPALAERVQGGVALYQAGKAQHLLMSGDNSASDYDEVSAMRDYAIRLGVPAAAITRDYAGFSTYETCFRAHAIFGVTNAVVVTQEYHLPRAVYTCRALGIDAVGLAIPDWQHHPERSATRYTASEKFGYTLREWLAAGKAFTQLHITRPNPTFLGRFEGLGEQP
jgi:vancomycin permeability regulator SanA